MDIREKLPHIWSMTITVVDETGIPLALAVGVSKTIEKTKKRIKTDHRRNDL